MIWNKTGLFDNFVLSINNINIDRVSNFKYLGHWFSDNIDYTLHL